MFSVALLRRVLLVAVPAFIVGQAQVQAQVTVVACLAIFALHIAVQPCTSQAACKQPVLAQLPVVWTADSSAETNFQESVCLFALCVVAALQDHQTVSHSLPIGASVIVVILVMAISLWLIAVRVAGDKLPAFLRRHGHARGRAKSDRQAAQQEQVQSEELSQPLLEIKE